MFWFQLRKRIPRYQGTKVLRVRDKDEGLRFLDHDYSDGIEWNVQKSIETIQDYQEPIVASAGTVQ